jgi:hypothetical protein
MEEQKYDPPAGCLLRISWMMVGNVVLLFCAYGITEHRSGVLSIADAFYWTLVGSLLAARYIDIRYLYGLTVDGDPASLDDWRRYAVFLVLVATGLWLVLHAVAYFSN